MTFLVTGASGLLGGHIVDLLLEQGERPRALIQPGDDPRRLEEIGAQVLISDIRDSQGVRAALDGIDYVVHCAARTGPWGDQKEYHSINVAALEKLINGAMSAGVTRVVHVSSITVHGNDVRGAADESSPFRVEPNPYSRSKVAGELVVQRLVRDEGAPVTVVRPGWIYGPRDAASFGRFAGMIERGQMTMIGPGRNHLPLVFVADVARGALLAATAEEAAGRAYLLVNDEPVTERQYLEAIAAELGVEPPSRRIPYRLALTAAKVAEVQAKLRHSSAPPPVTRYGVQMLGGENRFSISLAREQLGFQPQVDMADGVARSVQWYRASMRQGITAGSA